MFANLVAWIVLGLIAGGVTSLMTHERGQGLMFDVMLGIVGALVGGWIFKAAAATGVTGFDLWSAAVAVVGAVVSLAIWHAVRRSCVRA